MFFRWRSVRFVCSAEESVYFPPGKAANVLRGALGSTLRELSCAPECLSARTCARRLDCDYARIFEPVQPEGPSGLQDPPRPFVLRASHLDGVTAPRFHFDLNLFLIAEAPVGVLARAISRLADSGLGPGRGRVRLAAILVNDALWKPGDPLPPPRELSLAPGPESNEATIDFVTPTELKHEGRIALRPDFATLVARVRDRLGSLSRLYDCGAVDLDWKGLAERAAAVQLVAWNPAHTAPVTRFSTKTRQTHSLGGFTGRARYAGQLGEFLPLLRAAQHTGVGRQTVWGKGELRVSGN